MDPAFHIHYHLGMDGIAMPLILLTTLMTVLVALALMVLLLGLWPVPLLEVMGPSVEHLVGHLSRSKL